MATEIQKFKPDNYEEILKYVLNSGAAFATQPTPATAALIALICSRNDLIPAVDVINMAGRPYITVAGLTKLASHKIKYTKDAFPTDDEVARMIKLNWASATDTIAKIVAVLADGTELEFVGTANSSNSKISGNDKRTLYRHALARARHAAYTAITGFEAESQGNDFESLEFIDVSHTPAELPPAAQFVADTPKQRTPKAPKAEPTPEPAKPAEAEVETAKAENRARWAAESEQPAAEETVIETTVASKKSAPSPTPSVEAVADALTRLKERRDKPGFPVGAYVAAAFEDAQKFVDTAGAKGDYRAAFLIGRWHKSAEEIDGVWRSEPWQKFVGAAGSDVDALRKACVEFSPVSDDEPTPQDNF